MSLSRVMLLGDDVVKKLATQLVASVSRVTQNSGGNDGR